jgi:hypothetical protein
MDWNYEGWDDGDEKGKQRFGANVIFGNQTFSLCQSQLKMASRALQALRCARRVTAPDARHLQRHFSVSASALARRPKVEEKMTADDAFDILDDEYDDDDTATAGHIMLQEQRQVLHYLRLIEHEMPKLVGTFGSARIH